ncbi:GNAT family N-acetyltransferase [Paraburkholderia phenazinium]|uniref:Acetyltransferase (GNAT) domain-containing protein n=1 Tax=Paraburkholderia phenazinium TaxID=60549 RepID=A0A1N6JVK9_9BURK|nr:GNAT family N-acetyltransferase [Paraburkholderia phenazinium]SIO48066.1 Acetyltransferase (GNAT) domain-containing protein [Paraburkholderia phenazinium]
MKIEAVQSSDEAALASMMLRTIRTSVRIEADEMAAVITNVLANMHWAFDHAHQCVHLKCVVDGRIAGAVLVKNFWNLCSLFVEPGDHRRGIGRSLIEEAIRQCVPRNERPYVRVNAAPNAVEFYSAMGFTRVDDKTQLSTSTPMALFLSASRPLPAR